MQERTPDRLGPYRLMERLGEGGMGIVYLGLDAGGSMVAIKALRPAVAVEATARRRLAREVETMRRVHSPFVAEVIDADVTSDPPYLVTRYVPGRTLDDVIGDQGPLAGQALARLTRGLAAALTAVHSAGVVHRDLKPGNVMLVDGDPVVIDFGIAQLPEATKLTMTGMFMGTPGYLAPEVIEGKPSGPAADVHSWGATVAYAATGRPPFGTGSFETIFYRIVHGQPDLDGFPPPLLWMVVRALARDPSRRPAAAELSEWAAALNPAALVAAAAAGPGSAVRLGSARAGTVADRPARSALDVPPSVPAWPHSTRPLAAAGGFADLLPPVGFPPPAAPVGGPPVAWPGGQPSAQNGSRPPASGRPAVPVSRSARSAWNPLVIAAMVVAIAASVAFPVAGTAAAMVGLIGLRAAGLTGRRLAKRRAAQGRRPADALVAAAYLPLALLRSVLGFVLLAPLALLVAAVVAAIVVVVVPVSPLPLAGACGAGALVAVYGLGPGSGSCRRPLGTLFGAARNRPTWVVVFIAMCALTIAAIGTAVSLPPFYWPASHLGVHLAQRPLPTPRGVLRSIGNDLVTLARHFGA